jgi:hypothetical protein
LTNLIYGSRQGAHAGIKIAYGHTIVELPLIIILALGLSKISTLDLGSNEDLKIIGLVGGASITLFSLLQVRSLMKRKIVGGVDTISNKNYFFKINSKRSGPIIVYAKSDLKHTQSYDIRVVTLNPYASLLLLLQSEARATKRVLCR